MAQADATLTSPGLSPFRENNKLRAEDSSVHDWYRFVLSYPPHLVRDYLTRFKVSSDMTVLDPFCGTGTTLVECKKLGVPSVGIEANPMPQSQTV
jgi:adenine-specific DNA methylase